MELEEINNNLIINVPEGRNKPYSVGGKFYLRIGPNSQQLERDEIRDLFISEGLVHFDEKINHNFDVEVNFNEEAYRQFLRLSKISDLTDKRDLLENLYLLEKNNLKNAAVLLFCKKIRKFFNHATITCITFQGSERLKILDRKEMDDDLYTNYQNTFNYLKEKLNTEYIIKGGGPREEKLELPEEGLKEALLNGIGHRNYFTTTSMFVEIYSDRVEITNPGGLVKGLEIKDLGKKSLPRNNLLFGLLQRMNLVEHAGTGIRRMQKAMKDYKLETLEIEADKNWFSIIFKRPIKSYEERVYVAREGLDEKLGEKWSEKWSKKDISERQKQILLLILENPVISRKHISEIVGINQSAVQKHLTTLKENGIIKRVGPAKGGHWEVIGDENDDI